MNRAKIISKNVSLGVLYKGINLIIVFSTIPILLNYLDKEQYGLWVTIFSVVNIVFFVDGGIGNGLKTKLSEALSLKKYDLAKRYITTAYVTVLSIALVLLLIGTVLIVSLDLQSLFNTSIEESTLQKVLLTSLGLVIMGFVLGLYKSLYYANQQASKIEFSMLVYQGIVLLSVTVLLNFFPRNLLFISLVYGISNIAVGIVFTVLFFLKNKKIKPSIIFFDKGKLKELLSLSLAFFCIQLCMIIIFTTDNLIITNLIGPKEVTNYDIIYRLFQVVITVSIIGQDPLWALYTDAYQKKDFKWIRKMIIRLNKLFILVVFAVIILSLVSGSLIKIWIQRNLEISNSLIFLMSIFVLIRVYGSIYMYFLNAIGKIKLQMWLYVFGAIINIPISVFFVKQLELGASGVILGTIISIVLMSILLPLQTFKILKKNELD